MDRRNFLKLAAIIGAGLYMPGTVNKLIGSLEASNKIDLAVVTGPSPSEITRASINAIGGINKFISRGDIVVVKPNIAFDRLPEHAANTNPEVVATIVKMCHEAGARRVKVFDRTVNDPRRCYVQSGIAAAARATGAEVSFVDERKFRNVDINGIALRSWPIYTRVLNADKVINVPIAKHHSLTRLTMAMKNLMGVIGGARRQLHQRINESIVDLAITIQPTLTILDAVRILVANGPSGGRLEDVRNTNTVIAGIDQVAVDSFGATLFGMKGSDLEYVRIADRIGLGTMDISKINIKRIRIGS
jgi:uncharacterized protein (DUF362 family)